MPKKKKQFQISLYILVPFISSGIALLWVLLTDRVILHIQAGKVSGWTFFTWEVAVVVITYLMSLLITWLMLEPVSRFIKRAESLPVYPRPPVDKEESQTTDNIAHYSKVS